MKRMLFGLGLLFCGILGNIGMLISAALRNSTPFESWGFYSGQDAFPFLFFLFSIILTVCGLVVSIWESKRP